MNIETPRPAARSDGVLCYTGIMRTIPFTLTAGTPSAKCPLFLNRKSSPFPLGTPITLKDYWLKFWKVLPLTKMVFYFAKIKEHPDTKEKSQVLIQAQRLLKTALEKQNFKVILAGVVRGHIVKDSKGEEALIFKEKGVDVSIAVDMVAAACDGNVKTAILASSDSDLQPAIREITKRNVESIYLGFELQPNKGLTATTKRTILIRNSEALAYAEAKLL